MITFFYCKQRIVYYQVLFFFAMADLNKIDFDETNFFDSFPSFYGSSETGSSKNRLNNRYIGLIHNNKAIIKNSSILDLASHDGRWSYAAIKNGAKKVLGIEARDELVKKSFENMKKHGISREKYSFIVGDIFEKLKELKPNEFDVIFCFGIFYHITNHMLLLTEIKRLQPHYLILDTQITTSQDPIIHFIKENPLGEGAGIPDSSQSGDDILVGRPSKSALEMMLSSLGFDFSYFDWEHSGIKNWDHMEEYRSKKHFPFKKALRYGGSVVKDFKNKRKTLQTDIASGFSMRRITLVAKNRYFDN